MDASYAVEQRHPNTIPMASHITSSLIIISHPRLYSQMGCFATSVAMESNLTNSGFSFILNLSSLPLRNPSSPSKSGVLKLAKEVKKMKLMRVEKVDNAL
jgi:hypothetical protein